MLQLGTNLNISNKDYHADKQFKSSSALKKAFRDIAKYYDEYVLGNRVVLSSAAMDLGSYIHSRLLEPLKTVEEFSIFSGEVRRGREWEAFKSANADKICLTSNEHRRAEELISLVLSKPEAVHYLTDGEPEYTYCAELEGVPLKVRADLLSLNQKFLTDIKTTSSDLDDESLQKTIEKYDYDLSAALYVDMFELLLGCKVPFFFIFVGTFNKGVEVIKAHDELLENGRRKYKHALKKIKHAEESGLWQELKDKPSLKVRELKPASWAVFNE